jgi:dolichol-phosphate mannosyltransferase
VGRRSLARLLGGAPSCATAWRFACVGALGSLLDLAVFGFLRQVGAPLAPAHILAFLAATVSNYLLNARWTFASSPAIGTYVRFLVVCLLALAVRGAVLAAAVSVHLPETAALVAGIGTAAVVSYLGTVFYALPSNRQVDARIRWRIATIGVVVYMIVLRLAYAGLLELNPEEAYYWNYAKHLDIGYLDHPPMTAWIIATTTWLFGDREFAIRSGAILCWLLAALFMFRFARLAANATTAWIVILLMAVLPYFVGAGTVMSPDAPLVACWSAALYYLHRLLRRGDSSAWFGVGMSIGLGLLSKYTITLLGLATVIYCIVDPASRRWLKRPHLYAAALVALALFSPVILWNAQHDWTSFLFQSVGRWRQNGGFGGHVLLISIIGLVTPTALAAMIIGFLRAPPDDRLTALGRTIPVFTLVFLLVPLSIFIIHSLSHSPRLNWTGPLWLVALPLVAQTFIDRSPRPSLIARAWAPSVAVLLIAYGSLLHFAVIGIPGIDYPRRMVRIAGWRDLGSRIEILESEEETRTGEEPMIVGMDKYNIASQLAFYHPEQTPAGQRLGSEWGDTTGRHLFGMNSLMYRLWVPPGSLVGRTLLLVGSTTKEIDNPAVLSRVRSLGPIITIPVHAANGMPVGEYFCRFAYGYAPDVIVAAASIAGGGRLASPRLTGDW